MLYSPKEIEKQILKKWKDEKIPEKIVEFKGKNKFYLLDGPPYVNGKPHIGHIMTTTFKDVWGKFKKMQGHDVWFQPGFDCGGLPIENKVEQRMGIKTKSEIFKKGIGKFIEECDKFAKGNEKFWLEFYSNIGAWRGFEKPYLTSASYYKESGWWAIKNMYEKGLLVKGEKPNFWCPQCETVLSGYETTDTYKNLSSPSIFIKFKIKGKEEYLLAWTTTPWTLPSNVALCVHPKEKYVKIKVEGETIILAKNRLDLLDELEKKYEIVEEFEGKELEGKKYEPLLDIPIQKEIDKEDNAHRVVLSIPIIKKRVASKVQGKKKVEGGEEAGHLVDVSTGTGIVHIAPGHGQEDAKIGEHYNLPGPSPVDEQGKLSEGTGVFIKQKVDDANKSIMDYLNKTNSLFYKTTITHPYPLCWRCKTPLIYRKSTQWLLKLDVIREKMLEEIEKVDWKPGFAKEQFKELVETAPDWAITRQRFWGIPLPVWTCNKCDNIKVIGSRKELKENSLDELEDDFNLSVDVVDKIKLKCDCGGEMEREKAILDVWFDSGIATFASLGYPFKNEELFKKLYPVDLVDESQDQIRGWFYYLMLCGVSLFGETPYKTVCYNGWTLDKRGEKMSKSQGNIIRGDEAYKELGADLLRLYLCFSSAPWETKKISLEEAKNLQNKLNILWNLVTFIDSYSKEELKFEEPVKPENLYDKWLISKVNSLVEEVNEGYENFMFHYASRKIMNFVVNDFSRLYIKLVRDEMDKNKINTMLYTLEKVLKLLAPITPFITEYIYSKYSQGSIHLSKWPKVEKEKIDKKLEEKMKLAEEISTAINSERQNQGVKLRLPIKKVFVYGFKDMKKKVEETKDILKNLSNVKEIEFRENKNVKTKPNFASLGKKFGSETQKVAKAISNLDPSKVDLRKEKIKVEDFELDREDIIITKNVKEGEEFSKGYITLDLTEDEELKKERFFRELVREIQKARKEQGFNVLKNINLYLEDKEFIKGFEEILKEEVRAKEIVYNIKEKKGRAKYKDLNIKFGFSK